MDLESVQRIIGISWNQRLRTIRWSVEFKAMPLSTPEIIPYSSLASTLRVTLLHFVELQWTTFPWISNLSLVRSIS